MSDLPRGTGIVGRQTELARIETWLAEVSSGTRALIVKGEPGIGKTTLWGQALASWRGAGRTVLVAMPAMEEVSLALSALVDLFDDVIDVTPLRTEDDPITRGRTVLDALRGVAVDAPVLIAIDDLQWLDAGSARALRYALRRLDAEPIGVLATARTGASADPLDMANLLPPGRVELLPVGPLDVPMLRRLISSVVTAISPRTLRRIRDISGGNPLFALELARALTQGRADGQLAGALRLPDSLHTAILQRLETVSPDLLPLLETMSALARASLHDLREQAPSDDVDGLVTVAEQHDLLRMDADLEVRFTHPLIGSVMYERMHPLARRSVHARLARHATDPTLRARHLALCTDAHDATIAGQLDQAARRASERGSLGLAAELAEHSVRLTPPQDADGLRRHTLTLVRNLAAAGEMSRALVFVDRLIAQLPRGPARAEALVERAQLEDDDLETGEALLVEALADAGADAGMRGRVLDQLGWLRGVFLGDLPAGIACAREALTMASASGDKQFEMSAAAGLSNMETLAGTPRPDLMARAVTLEDEIGRPPLWAGPKVLQAEQLLWAGKLDDARVLLEAAVAHAERRTHERWRPYSLYDLAAVESAAGNLTKADELLRQAMEAARDCEDAHVESWIFYRLGIVLAWLGRASEARAAVQRRLDTATVRGERSGIARARSILGLLALSEADSATAAVELVAAAQLLEDMGFRHPGAIPALPDAIEALALVGDISGAQALLERLVRQAADVDSVWVHAAARRAVGTVALARGDDAAPLLRDASSAFTALGFRPDAARADLLVGRAHLRSGRRTAAADALAKARGSFIGMGAQLWADRAEEELERAAPGRATGRLTAAERRIARLVAEGRRNREIAQALFLSLATVEAHLTRTYRKLNIRSRSELTRLVTDGTVTLSDEES